MDLAGKRVLVTGGAGFLGRAVCQALRDRGVTDICVPRRSRYDLTSPAATAALFAAAKPQVVLHLAAEVGGIGANMRAPGRFCYANLALGLNVVEESRRSAVEKILVVGTVCSYPCHTPIPFREEDLWNGYPEPTNAGYGIAKRAVYELLRQYHAQYGLRSVVVIPTNLYGPHDNSDPATSHVIPAMIRQLSSAGPVVFWGTGTVSREFLYVTDAAEGIVRAAERIDTPNPINLGGGGEIVLRDLAELIATQCGYRGSITWDPSKPDGQPRRAVDSTRARQLLDWEPRVPLADGLLRTVQWWQCHRSTSS
jgi:GDP-L-fucose synthase